MNKPYTCEDERCEQREATEARCPWCWGGFPSIDVEYRNPFTCVSVWFIGRTDPKPYVWAQDGWSSASVVYEDPTQRTWSSDSFRSVQRHAIAAGYSL